MFRPEPSGSGHLALQKRKQIAITYKRTSALRSQPHLFAQNCFNVNP
jgi:hypothetical protein